MGERGVASEGGNSTAVDLSLARSMPRRTSATVSQVRGAALLAELQRREKRPPAICVKRAGISAAGNDCTGGLRIRRRGHDRGARSACAWAGGSGDSGVSQVRRGRDGNAVDGRCAPEARLGVRVRGVRPVAVALQCGGSEARGQLPADASLLRNARGEDDAACVAPRGCGRDADGGPRNPPGIKVTSNHRDDPVHPRGRCSSGARSEARRTVTTRQAAGCRRRRRPQPVAR